MPVTTLTTLSLVALFKELRLALESETINRTEEIEAILVAIVAEAHVFMISKPGRGKTMITDQLLARITGAIKFSILLSKFTDDQAIFGPWSVPALRLGLYERLTEGYLPKADIVFIDEIWKGSSALNNALLPVTNERRMQIGKDMVQVPLSTLICASNELPDAEHGECAAIYDRIDLRLDVQGLSDPKDMRRLHDLVIDRNPAPLLTWDEVNIAKAEAASLPISDAVKDAIVDITVRLRAAGIELSERRQRATHRIVRAAAWLAGDDEVGLQHLEILRHMLWDDPSQKSLVETTVLEVSSPMQADVLKVSDAATKLIEQLKVVLKLDGKDPSRQKSALEIADKLKRSTNEVLDLEDVATGRAATLLADTLERLDKAHALLAFETLGVTGGMSLTDTVRRTRP